MLLQTNSYIVPQEKRAEHVRLLRRFRHALARLGCDNFEVYEQVGANWSTGEPTGRYVQIMRFRDRRHQLSVQAAERTNPTAQAIIAEFCQLINFPYQQQQGLFAVGFYNAVLQAAPARAQAGESAAGPVAEAVTEAADAPAEAATGEHEVVKAVAGEPGEHGDYVPAAEASADAEAESPFAGETLAEVDGTAADALEARGADAAKDDGVEGGLEQTADTGDEIDGSGGGPEEGAERTQTAERPADAERTETAEHLEAGEQPETADRPFAEGGPPGEAADDELGALLDAHLDDGSPDNSGATPEDALGDEQGEETLDKFEALDALDIDDLDLPDSPLADPEQRQNRVTR